MAYPKPLSEKSIKKMYEESGLTDEKIGFLRSLFTGASFLYGVIPLEDLWNVYKELSEKTKTVKLQKKDILAFSSIARREEHDYYIYEIDELYTEEKRSDKDRFLILKEIMYGARLDVFYNLAEIQIGKPYYVPDNLTDIKSHVVTDVEKALITAIENLEATSPLIRPRFTPDKTKPSPHQGKKLKDFAYLNDEEDFEIRWLSGKCEHGPKRPQEKKLKEYLESVKGTFAEHVFKDFRFNIFTGWTQFSKEIKYFMESLTEVGVELSMKDANQLLTRIQNFSNNSHLYVNRGWTPSELAVMESGMNPEPQTITFGPGIMQAVKEGKISLDDLKKQVEAMGLKVKI